MTNICITYYDAAANVVIRSSQSGTEDVGSHKITSCVSPVPALPHSTFSPWLEEGSKSRKPWPTLSSLYSWYLSPAVRWHWVNVSTELDPIPARSGMFRAEDNWLRHNAPLWWQVTCMMSLYLHVWMCRDGQTPGDSCHGWCKILPPVELASVRGLLVTKLKYLSHHYFEFANIQPKIVGCIIAL